MSNVRASILSIMSSSLSRASALHGATFIEPGRAADLLRIGRRESG